MIYIKYQLRNAGKLSQLNQEINLKIGKPESRSAAKNRQTKIKMPAKATKSSQTIPLQFPILYSTVNSGIKIFSQKPSKPKSHIKNAQGTS